VVSDERSDRIWKEKITLTGVRAISVNVSSYQGHCIGPEFAIALDRSVGTILVEGSRSRWIYFGVPGIEHDKAYGKYLTSVRTTVSAGLPPLANNCAV